MPRGWSDSRGFVWKGLQEPLWGQCRGASTAALAAVRRACCAGGGQAGAVVRPTAGPHFHRADWQGAYPPGHGCPGCPAPTPTSQLAVACNLGPPAHHCALPCRQLTSPLPCCCRRGVARPGECGAARQERGGIAGGDPAADPGAFGPAAYACGCTVAGWTGGAGRRLEPRGSLTGRQAGALRSQPASRALVRPAF